MRRRRRSARRSAGEARRPADLGRAGCGARSRGRSGMVRRERLPAEPDCGNGDARARWTRPRTPTVNATTRRKRQDRLSCRSRARWRFSRRRRAPKATSRRRCCWRWRRCQSRGSATESPVFIVRSPTKRRRPCIRRGSGTARRRSPAIAARFAWRRSARTEPMWSPRPTTRRRGCGTCASKQPSFVALEGHQGRGRCRRRSARTEPMSSPRPLTRRRGCGTCARSSRASSPSKAIRVRSVVGGVQPGRNPCGHRVRRQDGAGVGSAREAAELRRPRRASGSGHRRRRSARTEPMSSPRPRQDGAGVGPAREAAELRRPRRPSGSGQVGARSARTEPMCVTASVDKTARVWDLREKQPSFVALEGHQGPVHVGGVQPGRNPCRHRVRRQDGAGVGPAREAAELRRPRRPSGFGLSAAFSPDGTHVVTASDDKTARVWDLRGSSRASSPSKAIRVRSLGGVQPGRNPCGHRVR